MSNTITKTQLINTIAASTGQSRAAVTEVVDEMLDLVQGAVAAGERVTIVGFGTWERRFREARDARNPQGGGTIRVDAKHVPAFKPGAGFKGLVATGK